MIIKALAGSRYAMCRKEKGKQVWCYLPIPDQGFESSHFHEVMKIYRENLSDWKSRIESYWHTNVIGPSRELISTNG